MVPEEDLRIDVHRPVQSLGQQGAIKITHLPTGKEVVVYFSPFDLQKTAVGAKDEAIRQLELKVGDDA